MAIIEWPSQMAPLVPQLRRLQYAANMLGLTEFCAAQGWSPTDNYARAKYLEFQALGRMHVFDDNVLRNAVEYYEKITAEHEAAREARS